MGARTLADEVRAILVKRAFVPGDPSMAGAQAMPPGGDPAAAGMPPAADPTMGAMPPGVDPSMAGAPVDPMGGIPADPAAGAAGPEAPSTGMINMTADEFTKFIKQMMAAFQGGASAPQQAQPDIGAKLDTLIAVLQGQAKPAAPAAPAVAGA